MRIAFITGCLEAGRDGVGDYTRLLAQECTRQGEQCLLLSLHDRPLSDPLHTVLTVGSTQIPVLRLPTNRSWAERTTLAQNFLAPFQPQWVSLHFVPYGFQDRGLVVGLGSCLSQLLTGSRLHLMFHELWIGQAVGASLKERLTGLVQRALVLRLLKRLQPAVVHTSNNAYQAVLLNHRVSCGQLPMFGAVPLTQKRADSWLFSLLKAQGLTIGAENRQQFWLVGMFGTLHPGWPPEPLFTALYQTALHCGRKVVLVSIGRLGYGEGLWNALAQDYADRFTFLKLGMQDTEQISALFNTLDCGIATTPYNILGKSATVAAMVEHGLPILVNWAGVPLTTACEIPPSVEEPLLYRVEATLPQGLGQRLPPRLRLPSVAARLLKDLKKENS
ncbi:hypothetical protein [Anthocerotibacter panamensis]|uniref:hypothetical protein n=1 Tax=Anthocerotibacter panamensis TaxID=2857077 RepID=UPI001C404686|nr:hypothetical protein [Anthocerotibacter panamensis]